MAPSTVVLLKTPTSGWQRVGGLAAPFDLKRIWREQADEETAAAAETNPDTSCSARGL